MKAFEVCLNGQRLCTAGAGEDGNLTMILHWRGRVESRTPGGEMYFRIGGVAISGESGAKLKEILDWPVPEVGVGDEITIKIVETDKVDPEPYRGPYDGTPGV